MDGSGKTLLIWVLAGAGLLVLLLYSPWGSPDLYTNRVYFAENQGVNFSSGIKNAPTGKLTEYTDADLSIQDYYAERRKATNYSANRYNPSTVRTNRNIAYNKSVPSNPHLNRRESGGMHSSNDNGGGSSTFKTSDTSHKSSLNAFSTPTVNSTSVDLSLFGDSTAQKSIDSAQRPAPDTTGAERFNIEPAPIPEGWGFLLSLCAIYAVIKFKLFKKLLASISLNYKILTKELFNIHQILQLLKSIFTLPKCFDMNNSHLEIHKTSL